MITLCQAFSSLMDLYGDYANSKVLAHRLEDCGQQVTCLSLPRFEGFDPDRTDMLLIGPGTESAALKACNEILPYAGDVKRFLRRGGLVLLSGNAAALFGQGLFTEDASARGLHIIEARFSVAYRLRRYSEIVADGPWGKTVGTVNTSCRVTWGSPSLFEIQYDSDGLLGHREGFWTSSIYATELTGPLLVNNPGMCDYFAEKLLGAKPSTDTEKWYALAQSAHQKLLDTMTEPHSK